MPTLTVARLGADPGRSGVGGPATIAWADGRITGVTPAADGEGGGLLVLPAPADAHDHGRGMRTVTYGAYDDVLERWIAALGQEPKLDPYLRAAVAFARMAEGGVCAANHCHSTQQPERLVEEAAAVSRAARDVGIRIAFAVPFSDRNPVVYGDLDALAGFMPAADFADLRARLPPTRSTAEALALVDAIAAFEHPCFTVQYGPIGPQWVCDETLEAIAAASQANGRRIHMHLFETLPQREWADHAYPGGLLAHLDRIGFLSPRVTFAHGVWLRPAELELLAARGVSVSVNSSSNLRLRSGIAPVADFVASGLTFGVGLDGMAFDDDEDVLREMRVLWGLQRGFGAQTVLDPGMVFDAACIAGRRTVLGEDGGGRIAVGAPADFITVDWARMTRDMAFDAVEPMALLLNRMSKGYLDRLVVGGRTIVAGGRCVTVDLPAMEAELTAAARAGWAAAAPDQPLLSRLQAAIGAFYRCGCHTGTPTGRPASG